MAKTYITVLHRGIASVLLTSQLLTSCGGTEIIVPSPEIKERDPITARERPEEESAYIVEQIEKEVKKVFTGPLYRNYAYQGREKLINSLQHLDNLPITNTETKARRKILVKEALALLGPYKQATFMEIPKLEEVVEVVEVVEVEEIIAIERILSARQARERRITARENEELERQTSLKLALCVFKPSLEDIKEITKVKEYVLAMYHNEANDLQEELAQHEANLNQQKEQLIKKQIELEHLKNVLEKAKSELKNI